MKFYKKALAGILVAATVTATAVPAFAAEGPVTPVIKCEDGSERVMTSRDMATGPVVDPLVPEYCYGQRVIISPDGTEKVPAVITLVTWQEDGKPLYLVMDNTGRKLALPTEKIVEAEPM